MGSSRPRNQTCIPYVSFIGRCVFLPLAPPGKPHMATKVIKSGFYSKDKLKLQNVFKNGDQKQDGLIEYVFAPFSV